MKSNDNEANQKSKKLLVCLFSDPNFLAVSILENLLSNKCVVNIVSDNRELWERRTSNIADKSKFFITSLDSYAKISQFSYAILCGGFIKKQSALDDFKKFIANRNFGSAKTLAVFPLETFSLKTSSKISMSESAGIVYVGDLLGQRIDLNSNLLMPSLVREMIEKRTLTLGVGETFFPLLVSDVAKTITKWLLSFGPYGKETFLVGPQVSSSDFWKQNVKSFPDLRVIYDTDLETRFIPKGYDIKQLNSNFGTLLGDTYRWIIRDSLVVEKEKSDDTEKPKKKVKKSSHLKFVRPYLLPMVIVLLFPLLTTFVSVGFLYLSYRNLLADRVQSSQRKALLAKTVFVIGKKESEVLSGIPVLGKFYKEVSFVSYIGETSSDIVSNTAPLALTAKNMLNNILGNGIYDVKAPSQELESGLEYLYQQISLVQLATEDKDRQGLLSARQLLNLVDFSKLKTLTQQGIVLANGLPEVLGAKDNKTYLVLFQNNMELRPTGGFIGSYGLATFGGGKLNGLTVNDIYSADGQLRGHVEPPVAIRKYLNEGNWWFRDSNWNPDFATSALRAEWFLNKEMGQQVDGVVAIDLMPIKSVLLYTGPIFLADYNLTVTADNLYEKTQQESQASFFPGSRKKASFLTALSRVLLSEVTNMDAKKRFGVLQTVYNGLSRRNIQIYLHNEDIQAAMSKLAWDGGIPNYSCGDGCYSDFFGDVEANVGVNKSSYFIKRSFDFNATINSQKITRDLSIAIQNSANSYLGPSGQYKTYFRIIIPLDAKVLALKVVNGQEVQSLTPDITQEDGHQEVGGFIEINPGESKVVKLIWESDLQEGSSIKTYGLYVRKQAGTIDDPLNVRIITPSSTVSSLPAFSLTKDGSATYNTTLSRDLFARLSWK